MRGLTSRSRRVSQGARRCSKRFIALRCGPRSAMKRGSQGVRRPTSICRPMSITSGPLTAPPTPGIGMKAGRVATNSSIPNARSPSPANTSAKRMVSSGAPEVSAASSSRVPGGRGAWCGLPPGSSLRMVSGRLRQALQQQLVDARAVEVDDLDPPALPLEVLADVRDAPELGDDHAGGGVVVVFFLERQQAGAKQFAQVVDGQAAVDEQRAVVAHYHQRRGVAAVAA